MMDGAINAHLKGKTVSAAYKDGHALIIETACGHSIRIHWQADNGDVMGGEPIFHSQSVKILLPMPGAAFGQAVDLF